VRRSLSTERNFGGDIEVCKVWKFRSAYVFFFFLDFNISYVVLLLCNSSCDMCARYLEMKCLLSVNLRQTSCRVVRLSVIYSVDVIYYEHIIYIFSWFYTANTRRQVSVQTWHLTLGTSMSIDLQGYKVSWNISVFLVINSFIIFFIHPEIILSTISEWHNRCKA
jgi:hypothetical protein